VRVGARRATVGLTGCWDRRETGVDSAWACPRCPQLDLGEGWPSRDRAVDAPAWQDVPAWEGIAAWLLERGFVAPFGAWMKSRRAPLTLLRAM
jgi:hypothetical protein